MTTYKYQQQNTAGHKKIINFMAAGVFSLLSCSVMAGDVSLQGNEPSSDDLLNAFLGQNHAPAATGSGSTVKYRGISLKKNTPKKTAPVEQTMQKEEKVFQQQVAANKSVSKCMAGKQSVAVNINFTPNSSNVTDPAMIKNIAQAMNNEQLAECYFVIEGHTDASGNDYYNLWLSQQRAGEVKAYLSQYNVTADRLVVVGKGEDELLNNGNPEAEENRRVVFRVINYK